MEDLHLGIAGAPRLAVRAVESVLVCVYVKESTWQSIKASVCHSDSY